MRCRFARKPLRFAVAAIFIAAPIMACAQSFNATGTIVAGAGAIATGIGTTTISADAANLVINWSPNDKAIGGGPIDFQAVGTIAVFTSRQSTALTVLNRIMPVDMTRPIVFGGKVVAQQRDSLSGAMSPGGTLFFYSPSGLLLAPNGVFNVGGLVLTTSDLAFDAGTRDSRAGNAAAVVPEVAVQGATGADGSAVIVAADASTITCRPDGLYDVQIDQGTSPSGEAIAGRVEIVPDHRVYVVAMPKNDAITLAIKGGKALGFDVAGAAKLDGRAVVLSAGSGATHAMIDDVRKMAGSAAPARTILASASLPSNPGHSCLHDLAATDDGAFISVGGIGSTLDVQGNREIAAPDGLALPATTGTVRDGTTGERSAEDDPRRCKR